MNQPGKALSTRLREYLATVNFSDSYPGYPPQVIARVLRYGAPLGSRIELHETLPRCMERMKHRISSARPEDEPLPSGTVIVARQLSQSSGRFNREWFAPAGGIWLAVAWADTLLPDYTRLLPMAAGTAGCEALRAAGVDARVKWVNDIHVRNRKIGGILCETVTCRQTGDRYQLVGMGINCNNTAFPGELAQTATSLKVELGRSVDLDSFLLEVLARLSWNFGLVHLAEEFGLAGEGNGRLPGAENPVVSAWKGVSDTLGRRVVYGYDVLRDPRYEAVAEDVDQAGALVLRLADGSCLVENSGEILYLEEERISRK